MLQQFYNHQSYLSYGKQIIEEEPHYQNLQQMDPHNRVIEIIPDPLVSKHIYVNKAIEDEQPRSLKRVVSVRTLEPTIHKPNYFFGDSLGELPCRNCNRSLETIEASITFDEENEEHSQNVGDQAASEVIEDDYSPVVTNTLTKDQILEIFCHSE